MLETLDHTIRIGSTPTFLYFDLYIYILTLKVKRGLLIYRGQQCFWYAIEMPNKNSSDHILLEVKSLPKQTQLFSDY